MVGLQSESGAGGLDMEGKEGGMKKYKRSSNLPKGFYKTDWGYIYYVDAYGCEFNVGNGRGKWVYMNYEDEELTAEIERELPAYLKKENDSEAQS